MAWARKHKMVSEQGLSYVSTPLVNTPCNTPPYYHTPCNLAGVWSHSLVKNIPLPHPLVITPLVIWPSLLALDSNRRPVSTPPQCHTPSLTTPPAEELLCMVLITGGTLDTTHLYKSTPGGDIFKS